MLKVLFDCLAVLIPHEIPALDLRPDHHDEIDIVAIDSALGGA